MKNIQLSLSIWWAIYYMWRHFICQLIAITRSSQPTEAQLKQCVKSLFNE